MGFRLSTLNKLNFKELSDLPLNVIVAAIKKSNKLYHDTAKPILEDYVYDALKDILKERKPNHSLLRTIGSGKTEQLTRQKKEKLPYPLYSLDKIKPENAADLDQWCDEFPGPYIVSDKEDGSSLEIVYGKDRKLDSIFTRGNGIVGQRVTRIAQHLNIPKAVPIPGLVVRAELVMPDAKFKKYASGEYANPRNLVAGLANKFKGDTSLLKHADAIAYEIIFPRFRPSVALKKLKSMGFHVVPYKVFDTLSVDSLVKHFKKRKADSPHTLDGIVLEQDQANKRPPEGTHSPSYAKAFKILDEDSIATTKVLGIEWEISRHGLFKPVLLIKPVKLSGVTINRVTAHNAYTVKMGFGLKDRNKDRGKKIKPLGKGAIISLTRSGDVIPKLLSVVKGAANPQYPKGNNWVWNTSGTEIVLRDDKVSVKGSEAVRIKRITNFFTTLGVDGIKQGTVEQLVDAGYDSIVKIIRASSADFLEIDGFKDKKANTLWANIHDKIKAVPLDVLMDGSGHFGSGFGTRRLNVIVKAYPNLLNWGAKSDSWVIDQITTLPGFKETTAEKFAVGLPKFLKWLKVSRIKPVMPKAIKVSGSRLKGQSVCFTGFRDKDLEELIVAQGGKIASGVNKNTTILISAGGNSSKTQKAKSLGIKIFDEAGFRRKYGFS